MSKTTITQLTVLDLVPFGNVGSQTAFFALRLTPPDWDEWSPGQFVMLRPSGLQGEHLWGRPFSICHTSSRDLVIFFQVRGRATAEMARLVPDDRVDVWGPLGNAFAVSPAGPTLLLAGGIGIAPFVGYAQNHPRPASVSLEFGHRLPVDCYPFEGLAQKIEARSHLENGPEDRTAFLELVNRRMREHAPDGLVLACGPTPFLKTVQEFALRYKVRTQICLETRMACGIGACLGCVVKAKQPHNNCDTHAPAMVDASEKTEMHNVQTCTCGPNFWADNVSLS